MGILAFVLTIIKCVATSLLLNKHYQGVFMHLLYKDAIMPHHEVVKNVFNKTLDQSILNSVVKGLIQGMLDEGVLKIEQIQHGDAPYIIFRVSVLAQKP